MDAVLVKRDALRERFAAEAMSTSSIASPHLLQTRDAGIDGKTGRPWFTTDVLQDADLATRVSRDGARPLSEVRAIVAALGDALGKSHALGRIHHDLTPENIHLGSATPPPVTLRELTISRLVAEACAAEGNLFGTALWMPPEQFQLGRPLDAAANVWSLGLIAFYAATGRSFWTKALDDPAPSQALVHEIRRGPIPTASDRASTLGCAGVLPPWFDTWFARCVVRDAGQRFPDARAAYASFVELMDGAPCELAGEARAEQQPARPPPSQPPPRGRRSVPPAAMDIPSAPIVSHAPANAAYSATVSPARARGRGRRKLGYVAALCVAAGLLVWLSHDRHRGDRQGPLSSAVHSAERNELPTAPALQAEPSAPASHAEPTAPPTPTPPADAPVPPPVPAIVASAPAVAVRTFPAGNTVGQPTEYSLASALKAVNRVHYGDCALPSNGKVAVTFAASGHVQRVALLHGNYDERTVACIAARFGTASTPPFRGAAQTVTADLVATR
jgi:serine/threonine protein kinase